MRMEAIVNALLLWIAANSQYNVDNVAIPSIVFVSREEITAEYYSDHPEFMPKSGFDDRIWALYDAESIENGQIFLRLEELADASAGGLLNDPEFISTSLKKETQSIKQNHAESFQQQFEQNPIMMERLLHELVHHVQFQTGANESFPCPAVGEKDAYQLGELYFKQRHIEDPLPNRNFWAHIYSRC